VEGNEVVVILLDGFVFFLNFLMVLAQSLYEGLATLKHYTENVIVLDRMPRGLISQQEMPDLPCHGQAPHALTFAPIPGVRSGSSHED
jgi:hypothetical protein